MNTIDDTVISTKGFSKNYGSVTALKPLNLEVRRNSIFGFLGPNGAGKSTTIRLLLGLIRPTSGTGKIFGMDIASESASIRRRIGYLPQKPSFYGYMNARETLRFTAGFFYNRKDRSIDPFIDYILETTGLQERADRPVKGLSGGELQRLGIAQALVNKPDLLILDEPASSLDPLGRRDVLEVMRRLKGSTTIFYSTHILDDVERVSDAVGIMNHGQLVTQKPIGELLATRDRIVYDIIFQGDVAAIRQAIEEQPWVRSVDMSDAGTHTKWSLTATDESSAEKNLLRMMLGNESVTIKEFSRRKDELEDVFMKIVEEACHG